MKENFKIIIAIILVAITSYVFGFSDGQESAYLKIANKKTDYIIQKNYKGE